MKEDEKNDMAKALLDAMPSLVFAADQDVRIQDYNAAAAGLIMAARPTVSVRSAEKCGTIKRPG